MPVDCPGPRHNHRERTAKETERECSPNGEGGEPEPTSDGTRHEARAGRDEPCGHHPGQGRRTGERCAARDRERSPY